MRLDLALIRGHPGMSRRKARDVIEKGQVLVGGELVREAGREVAEGAPVSWDPNRRALPRARSSLPILHQDDWLLIVDKPAGLLTVPSAPGLTHQDTALARVKQYVLRLRPRRPFVGVVHRLDRDTSGVVAFALTSEVRQALRDLFRHHRIERRYLALVAAEPKADHGTVELPVHEAYAGGRRRLARPGQPALPALTRWTVRERFGGAGLLEVELQTGRQHQIRLHLAHVGLPVLGDPVYGRPHSGVRRQMLHAQVLAFAHPVTGAPVRVESPLPPDFEKALALLRRGRASRRRALTPAR